MKALPPDPVKRHLQLLSGVLVLRLKETFYLQLFSGAENFVCKGKLTQPSQESFNSVFNEDQGVFAVITRLFQTGRRFTEGEVINPEIRLLLEQAEPCVIQRCFGIQQLTQVGFAVYLTKLFRLVCQKNQQNTVCA